MPRQKKHLKPKDANLAYSESSSEEDWEDVKEDNAEVEALDKSAIEKGVEVCFAL